MNEKYVLGHLRNIPNFPKKGIQYKDINFLFTDAGVIKELSDELVCRYKNKRITKIVGVETRGIIMAAILAEKLNAGLVMCRKKGKMPGETKSEKYEKEYGFDEIEIQENSITKDDVILIHDDLLATGGSMKAAYNLVQKFSPKDVFMNFIFELKSECPDGRKALPSDIDIQSLIVI